MSAQKGVKLGLIGATGAVGGEILEALEERRLPVNDLVGFASEDSEAQEMTFRGEDGAVQRLDPAALASCDVVICAAPEVLRPLLPALRDGDVRVIDVSGVLEADPSVPLHLPGVAHAPATSRLVAVPRGVVAGAALALAPLAREVELTRATLVCLEAASAAGMAGISELTEHTISVLNEMTGETPQSDVFERSLAFDCLPLVGETLDDGDSTAERDMRGVLRRLLNAPSLPLEVTRVRIPAFGGSVAAVHTALAHDLAPERARELWLKVPGVRVLDPLHLPTPRSVLGHDEVAIGRLRRNREDAPGLAFVLALDNLRRGAALGAVDALEVLLG